MWEQTLGRILKPSLLRKKKKKKFLLNKHHLPPTILLLLYPVAEENFFRKIHKMFDIYGLLLKKQKGILKSTQSPICPASFLRTKTTSSVKRNQHKEIITIIRHFSLSPAIANIILCLFKEAMRIGVRSGW